ncbi:MAG: hypothetical protein PHQ28_00595 [Mycobacterium sp.]|nr:hypothetical protein [Mycobacterium sp.]
MDFGDAEVVRGRVEARAAQLRLRGARRRVLTAVLTLLCGWSKIHDDRLALTQLADLITAAGGRRYDLKTIGRALASLAADGVLCYRPAQGRGVRAFVAIADQFTTDITVLGRDREGHVISSRRARDSAAEGDSVTDSVTFCEPLPYTDQPTYPPTPRKRLEPNTSRPTEVEVLPDELRQVLAGLPQPLTQLPRHLRWMLGAKVRNRLAAGWRPEQILDILAQPIPADLQRPWRLALWRLTHNVPGAGPRLRPLQQAWDQQVSREARDARDATTAHWYAEVTAATSAAQRADLLAAHEIKFGRVTDPIAALAGAGRRVHRLFPELSLTAALTRWITDVTSANRRPEPVSPQSETTAAHSTDLLTDLAIRGGTECAVCGSHRAIARLQLPLRSMVCDQCWLTVGAELEGSGAGAEDGQWVAA